MFKRLVVVFVLVLAMLAGSTPLYAAEAQPSPWYGIIAGGSMLIAGIYGWATNYGWGTYSGCLNGGPCRTTDINLP